MSQVSAVGHVFSTEDYENAPLFYARSLEKAKIEVDAETNALNQSVEATFRRTGARSPCQPTASMGL